MKNTFSFKKHFARNAFLYVGAVLATLLVFTYSINLKLKPKDYETFSIFIGEYNVNLKTFREKLENVLGEDIIEINTYHISSTSSAYSRSYSTQGYTSDLLILPEDAIIDNDVKAFTKIPVSYQSDTDYVLETYHKGIKMFDGETGVWSDFITYQAKSYYLFINPESVHLNGIEENGKTDSVLRILEDINNEKK